MKILMNIICAEFIRAGYQKEEVEEMLFLKHKENHDYWICTRSFDLEHQHELFEKAINFWKQYKESEKNISVLILREVAHLSKDEMDWSIEIENDPLFFKKYVILFRKSQCEPLEKIIENNQLLVSLLMQDAVFKQLKEEKENDGPYSLLYSIAHKLPFITMNIQPSEYKMDEWFFNTPEQAKLNAWLEQLPEDEKKLKKEVELLVRKQ